MEILEDMAITLLFIGIEKKKYVMNLTILLLVNAMKKIFTEEALIYYYMKE